MKRTKKETRENYLAMMTEMWRLPRFYLRDMIEKYKVSANIGAALLKASFINRMMKTGYYKYVNIVMPTMSDVEKVLSILKSRNKPAPEVVEVSNAVGNAYPKQLIEDYNKAISDHINNATVEDREQYALNILADIMRDNQHITYTLKRIEREVKETETTIL